MAVNGNGRDEVAQMIAYLLREAGVLFFVFEVVHYLWTDKLAFTAILLKKLGVSLILMTSGVVLERKRRLP